MEYEFGMFSDDGEAAVAELVKFAGKYALTDSTINALLEALSKEEVYSEATDTVVRERVFKYLDRAAW